MMTDVNMQEFLDNLASSAATPGGGGAAAMAGAMGAALVSMVCNLTLGKKRFAPVSRQMQATLDQSEALRRQLAHLVEDDATAFQAVMEAYRLPKDSQAEQAARADAIAERTKQAVLVPMEVAHACAEVIKLAHTAAKLGNPNVVTDAGAAALCAQNGLHISVLNVYANLANLSDPDFVTAQETRLNELLNTADPLAARVYDSVKQRVR